MRNEDWVKVFTGVAIAIVLLLVLVFCTPEGRRKVNNYMFEIQQVDDHTNYKTLKQVEDTCRAMISSYTSDKMMYMQYKDSDIQEERNWANQAKNRANKTASTYNNYLLQNRFVWKDNVPSDILNELTYLE